MWWLRFLSTLGCGAVLLFGGMRVVDATECKNAPEALTWRCELLTVGWFVVTVVVLIAMLRWVRRAE